MLLSKGTLDQLQENESETKLDRVKLYVSSQKEYIDHYASPNPSIISSVPSSCADDKENSDAISKAFTASISEILRRKYAAQLESVREDESRNKKKKSVIEIDPVKPTASLPKTKSNGFHLLEKFVSPNLEINRVTLKSNTRKKPKVGLFNKGKSSATGKTVPDLVFSESQFLKKQSTVDKEPADPETSTFKAPTVSRFFKQTPSVKSSSNQSSATDIPAKKSSAIYGNHSPILQCKKRKQEDAVSTLSSETSYTSLIRSFHQHQFKPSSAFEENQHATPLYSYMRTPNNNHLPRQSIFSNMSHRHSMTPSSFNSRRYSIFSPFKQSMLIPEEASSGSYKADHSHETEDSSIYVYYQNKLRDTENDHLPFDLNWQVDESVAPSQYVNQGEKDDLELIMESPAIHLLNQQIQEHENEIQNFWVNQSYKRKL